MENKVSIRNPKNLTLEERHCIERYLKDGLSFTEIAMSLSRNRKTISREIKSRRFAQRKDPELRKRKCAYLNSCDLTHLCNHSYCKHTKPCSKCRMRSCSQYCDNYVPGTCSKLLKPPYVCNGCSYPRTCGYDKMYYRARYADDLYHEIMSTSRKGIDLSPEELFKLDDLVSPLLLKGQSIAHIYVKHAEIINCSKRTLYHYVDSGLLSAKNMDLPRKVRYKPRKKKTSSIKKDQTYRVGRTYEDFLKHVGHQPDLGIVEMDIVEGKKGGKVILTLLFRQCNFMLMFLLDSSTQESVSGVFEHLNEVLGTESMKRTFPVLLTDNGSEFKNPESIEMGTQGEVNTRIFYCDPHKSWQKARIEKNHEFIRYILPKGKTFDKLTQQSVTLMANHINSIARASLNGKTPFQLATMLINNNLLQALELHPVPHDEVLLKPRLLKK